MKYFTAGLLLLTFAFACSPTDTVTETEPEEEAEDHYHYAAPGWYHSLEQSKADSVSFYGIAFAASSDSADAAQQSTQLAEKNLLLAIDQFAEDVRAELAEESDQFSSAEFIITLRNIVTEMDLSEADYETEHVHYRESVHHIYSKGTIPIETVKQRLAESELGERFVSAFQ